MAKALMASCLALFQAVAMAHVRLEVWQPSPRGPKLVLPVPAGGSPRKTAAHYLAALFSDASLSSLTAERWLTEAKGTFSDFPKSERRHPAFALLDNAFESRKKELATFERGGARAYLVPLAADLAVDDAHDRAEFRELLAEHMQAMVALGGDDVAPALYDEPVTYARDTNQARDERELRLIRHYLRSGKGVLYGICRGHQLIAVAFGFKLIQDLQKELGVGGHEDGEHAIRLVGSSLLGDWAGESAATVNSYHHEAVNFASNPHGQLHLTATAGSGTKTVTEGLQDDAGRVVTVQFHPELMKNDLGRAIIRGMVEHARELAQSLSATGPSVP